MIVLSCIGIGKKPLKLNNLADSLCHSLLEFGVTEIRTLKLDFKLVSWSSFNSNKYGSVLWRNLNMSYKSGFRYDGKMTLELVMGQIILQRDKSLGEGDNSIRCSKIK